MKGIVVEFVILYLLVNIAAGALACFMGKRLFYIVLGVLVFLGVFNIGLAATDGSPTSFAIAAVFGIIAALLSKYAYKAGVFLIGFVAGAALGFFIGMLVPNMSGYLMIVVILGGALVGLAAVRWCDLFVRIGTAYTGASFLVSNALAVALAFPSFLSAQFRAMRWRRSTRLRASSAASSRLPIPRHCSSARSCSPLRA